MKSAAQFEKIAEAWKLNGADFKRFHKWYFKDRTQTKNTKVEKIISVCKSLNR